MNHEHDAKEMYSFKSFLPLIVITVLIISFTIVKNGITYGWELNADAAMYDFMGSFFVVFGLFKIINLHGFVQAYSTYDLIAGRSLFYAYSYPFIELGLGIAYFTRSELMVVNWITFFLMVLGSMGVAHALAQKRDIVCACLGNVFHIPMTYVTLAEDGIMGIMALVMLIRC